MSSTRKTSLTTEINDETHIRGYSLNELIKNASFTEAVFLLLTGKLPSTQQKEVFTGVLVSAIDHGVLAPSTDVARRVASTGNSINTAVAAGVATIGDYHGGAIEQAGKLFHAFPEHSSTSSEKQAQELVAEGIKKYKRIPGFGHKIYTTDPRVTALFNLAKKHGLPDHYLKLAQAVEKELEATKGRKLCINIDGGMAAVLLALGLDWQMFRGVFIIARTPGLVAHAVEQQAREKPVMRSKEEAEYDGPQKRPYPSKKKG
ncbi:citryl-CoA lyase [Patescibacteria group bacterium]